MNAELTIGIIAKRAAVNVQTVRYYERRGLLAPGGRRRSGYRLYTPETVLVIRFIKNAQRLGFSLEEISRLLRLRVGRGAQCGPAKRQAEARLGLVREKIADLRAMEKALLRLLKTCARRGTTDHCPILESLKKEE
ncbi:MAG: MerR family transcriptional regulator [Elusimicrobia bacterium]|nr:MerR family transcriptional regulator [Elusimicrobiota bacterium]